MHRPFRNIYQLLSSTLFVLLALTCLEAAEPKKPAPPQAAPSLTLKQVQSMITSELNSVDILVEAKSRGLAFVVNADVIKDFEDRGADAFLINWLGLYSVELRPLYASCIAQQQQKRFGRVVEVCTELLNQSPRLLHIYLIRGAAYRAQNQLTEAASDFRQAMTFHKNSSRARVLLGEVLIAQKETDGAIAELNWVLDHRSASGIQDWPTANRLLAEAYLQRREYRLASKHLHTALWQLPVPHPESVTLLPALEDHMSVLVRLLALCPDSAVASPADAIEIANLMKLVATNKEQQQVALQRLAEGQAAAGQFDAAVATQKAAEILSEGDSTAFIRERLALYEKKQVPLLPAGAQVAETNLKAVPKLISVATFFDRMKLVGENVSEGMVKPFWIAKLEITQSEWASIMDLPKSLTPDLPADRMSWDQCQVFLKKLNEQSTAGHRQFRLPTASEWKFAAQAGSTGRFCFGDDASELAKYAWFIDHGDRTLHKGGMLQANSFDLFDVYGNVAEWCQDEVSPSGDEKAEKLPAHFRVVAGGSCFSSSNQCATAVDGFCRQNEGRRGLGFRLASDKLESDSKSEPTTPQVATKPAVRRDHAGLSLAIDYARSTLEAEVFQRVWLQDKLFTLLYLQACVRGSMDDADAAITNLRELIREMPDDNSPLMHLTRCHLAWIQCTREGATPEQIAEARRIVETSLSRSEFKLWIGYLTQSSVLVAEGNFADATRRATQANDLAPLQFKEICASQLKAIEQRKSAMSRQFPVSPAISPATVFGL
jgi:formylglycine-generating enzyme required for sulfatase activity